LSDLEQNMGPASEMSLIRNLHWWTVEYGLIGDLENPKIYGAGLLSSIGESYNCLQPNVKKLPYTLDAVNYNFDITNQQPQLFVTEDFENLNKVLDQFADTMALRRGGVYGLKKAIESENDATVVYSSGLQVSGVFNEYIEKDGDLVYIKTNKPTTLNYEDKVLEGHGKDYHAHGFSSPVGKLKNISAPLEALSEGDLKADNIKVGEKVELEFESGVLVKGKLENILTKDGRNLIFSFSDCTVTYQDITLFQPEWGMFDMAVGERIVSAFSGPADPVAYGLKFYVPEEKTHKIVHSERATKLHNDYQKVRDIREGKLNFNEETLKSVFTEIKSDYPEDWLLSLEILEILTQKNVNQEFRNDIRSYLDKKSGENESFKKLITDGLEAVSMA
jgi:phenylalanine-4-hydroxylase